MAATAILAQSCAALPMEVNVGFGGAAKQSVWTPISVKLTNTGAREAKGTLVVKQIGPDIGTPPLCSVQVDLPANSTKLYHIYTKLDPSVRNLNVVLAKGRRYLALKKVNVSPLPLEDMLIVTVGGPQARLSFLARESISAVSSACPSTAGINTASMHVGSVEPSMLPDRPAAYEGVDVVVLGNFSAGSADAQSLKALAMWVAGGGTLVVSAGPNHQLYKHGFYDEMLPVDVSGTTALPGIAALSRIGDTGFPTGQTAVVQSTVKPGLGKVMVQEAGVPILTQRSYGAGMVIFLAADYSSSPFRDWKGQTEFWKSIAMMAGGGRPMSEASSFVLSQYDYYGPGGYSGGYHPGVPQQYLASVVTQNPDIGAPSVSTIMLFLLAYLVLLVPVNYFVLRRKRRLELAWFTTPAIVILFTVGAYAMGYTMKGGKLQVREAVIIEGSNSAKFARVVTNTDVFSPARRSYDLRIRDEYSVTEELGAQSRSSRPEVYLGSESIINDLKMAMWSNKTMESVSGVELPGVVEADLEFAANKLSGKITNNTGMLLPNCSIIFGGAVKKLGDVKNGGTVDIEMQHAAVTGRHGYVAGGSRFQQGTLENSLSRYITWKVKLMDAPVLVSIARRTDAVLELIGDSTEEERAICYAFRLGYTGKGSFVIPQGMIRSRVLEGGGGYGDYSENPAEVLSSVSPQEGLVAEFQIPAAPGARITAIKFRGTCDPANAVIISAFDFSKEAWSEIDGVSGKWVEDPSRYISAANCVRLSARSRDNSSHGRVRLSVEVRAENE